MKSSMNAMAGLALLGVAACGSAPTAEPPQQAQLLRAISAPDRLEPAESLPGPAREILRTRMASHAQDMGELMQAIMILSYRRIEVGAQAIMEDVRLARPLTGDATELNSALPEKFFDLQDKLRVQARSLRDAARSMSAFAVADAYGRVSDTCVQCHGTYRGGGRGH